MDIEKSFHGVRSELALISRALYCVELCRELLRDEEPHADLLGLAVDYLSQLEDRTAGPTSLIAFELKALAMAGFMPRFGACSVCGDKGAAMTRFDPPELRTTHGNSLSVAAAMDVTNLRRVVRNHLFLALGVLGLATLISVGFGTRLAHIMSAALRRVNDALKKMRADGRYDALVQKWFGRTQ